MCPVQRLWKLFFFLLSLSFVCLFTLVWFWYFCVVFVVVWLWGFCLLVCLVFLLIYSSYLQVSSTRMKCLRFVAKIKPKEVKRPEEQPECECMGSDKKSFTWWFGTAVWLWNIQLINSSPSFLINSSQYAYMVLGKEMLYFYWREQESVYPHKYKNIK